MSQYLQRALTGTFLFAVKLKKGIHVHHMRLWKADAGPGTGLISRVTQDVTGLSMDQSYPPGHMLSIDSGPSHTIPEQGEYDRFSFHNHQGAADGCQEPSIPAQTAGDVKDHSARPLFSPQDGSVQRDLSPVDVCREQAQPVQITADRLDFFFLLPRQTTAQPSFVGLDLQA
jgi:hypothetical protein